MELSINQNLPLLERVELALSTIRPYLKTDGGDVKVITISNGIVEIEMLGSCGDCPMSKMTLKAGIEQAVLKLVPEIKAVRAIHHEVEFEFN
jgi:Fe-S cluster biogenesis protein NfuA